MRLSFIPCSSQSPLLPLKHRSRHSLHPPALSRRVVRPCSVDSTISYCNATAGLTTHGPLISWALLWSIANAYLKTNFTQELGIIADVFSSCLVVLDDMAVRPELKWGVSVGLILNRDCWRFSRVSLCTGIIFLYPVDFTRIRMMIYFVRISTCFRFI